jgi:phage/plasmid-like protein (TIGR03299 family)
MTGTATLPKYSADSRALPWNVLGGDLTTEHGTVAEALTATGLDYNVFTVQSAAVMDDGTILDSGPEFRQVVRPRPDGGLMVIGQSGTRLTPIQNRDAFAVADVLAAEYGATIKGACDYRNGKISVMVVGLGEITLKGGQDVVDLNLLIRAPHDGSGALSLSLTAFRPTCTNAVHAAIAKAKQTWKISNTPNAQGRIDLAKQALIEALNYRDAFQVKAEAMLDQAMADAEFDKIIANLYPIAPDADPDAATTVRRHEIRDTIRGIYQGPTVTGAGVGGTIWGGYSAVTEYLDWYRPVKGDAAKTRAEAQVDLTNPYAKRSARMFDLFAAAV